jgi:hypothetical protein
MNALKSFLPVILVLLTGCAEPMVIEPSIKESLWTPQEPESIGIKTNGPSLRELTDGYDWSLDKSKLLKCEETNPLDRSIRDIDPWYWQFLTDFSWQWLNH